MIFAHLGKNLNFERTGNAVETLLLVHGWGGSSKSLKPIFELAQREFTVVTVDLPGFGQSSLPEENWGVNEYGDFLAQFIMSQNLKNVTYFGHSFGGTLGIYIAATYPNLVKQLALCAPSFKRVRATYRAIKNPFYKKIKKLLWPIRRVYYKIKYPKSEALLFPKLEENFAKIVTQDQTELLANINQKTLVLWGKADTMTPVENAQILKNGIKNCQLHIYEDIGHALPLRKPEEIFQQIRNFVYDH